MDKNTYIYIIIIGMSLVTFIPRVVPLVFFSKYKMHPEIFRFLSYFPPSILTALIAESVFFVDGRLDLSLANGNIVPGIITLIFSIKYRSIALSVALGLISYIVFNFVL